MKSKVILPVIFVMVFALSRMPGLMPPDFSAVYAFAFCGGVFFKGRLPWWMPLLVILATDLGLNCYYDHEHPEFHVWGWSNLAGLAFNYVAYAALIFLGRCFNPGSSLFKLVGGGLLGAILFYLISNSIAWLLSPEYAKSVTGWIIALTKGMGGYPETWEFFRNTLLSGGLFTALFAAAEKATSESPADKNAGAAEPEPEAEPQPGESQA